MNARPLLVLCAAMPLLTGCMIGRSTMGMEIHPGRGVEVQFAGRDPVMCIENFGPGAVNLHIGSPFNEQDVSVPPGGTMTLDLIEPGHLGITTKSETVTTIRLDLRNYTDLSIRG